MTAILSGALDDAERQRKAVQAGYLCHGDFASIGTDWSVSSVTDSEWFFKESLRIV